MLYIVTVLHQASPTVTICLRRQSKLALEGRAGSNADEIEHTPYVIFVFLCRLDI